MNLNCGNFSKINVNLSSKHEVVFTQPNGSSRILLKIKNSLSKQIRSNL